MRTEIRAYISFPCNKWSHWLMCLWR